MKIPQKKRKQFITKKNLFLFNPEWVFKWESWDGDGGSDIQAYQNIFFCEIKMWMLGGGYTFRHTNVHNYFMTTLVCTNVTKNNFWNDEESIFVNLKCERDFLDHYIWPAYMISYYDITALPDIFKKLVKQFAGVVNTF